MSKQSAKFYFLNIFNMLDTFFQFFYQKKKIQIFDD